MENRKERQIEDYMEVGMEQGLGFGVIWTTSPLESPPPLLQYDYMQHEL